MMEVFWFWEGNVVRCMTFGVLVVAGVRWFHGELLVAICCSCFWVPSSGFRFVFVLFQCAFWLFVSRLFWLCWPTPVVLYQGLIFSYLACVCSFQVVCGRFE